MSDTRYGGLPLLSGPPPAVNDSIRGSGSCRKCSKEFNVLSNLFNRAKQCNHCGYLYCAACTDYQALMPRAPPETSGYDPKPVCAFCIEYLNITASGRAQLKNLPISKLKQYVKAYDIKINRVVEKDDFIDVILSARTVSGCLPRQAERYYRKYSVPDRTTGSGQTRGLFNRHGQNQQGPRPPTNPPPRQNTFARPDLEPDRPHTMPPPTQPRQAQSPTPTAQPSPRPAQPRQRHSDPPSSQTPYTSPNLNVPPASSPPPRTRSTSIAPPPPLDELIAMSPEAINAMAISTLKAVLFANHVNARLILEKAELVAKVNGLVEEERQTRERHRLAEEQEMEYARLREQERQEDLERERRRAQVIPDPVPVDDFPQANSKTNFAPGSPPKIPTPPAFAERSGLCVICQDEEASIVIVDCGHLCLCRDCSGVVMQSTRECPLCRTRIVTEQRLLRVFKT